MDKHDKIYVAGHTGLVGSAICRLLAAENYSRIITATRSEVDLTDPISVRWFFSVYEPEYVFLCAAKVGGIVANRDNEVDFFRANMAIQDNVLHNAKEYGAKKLLFLSSACAYPKHAANPLTEDKFMTGELEPTNRCYALAKLAGMTMCDAYRKQYGCDYITAVPTNLYGPGDHYDLTMSHVLPGMLRRIHEAKQANDDVVLWGTGNPTRQFLYSEDLARACVLLMERYSDASPVNVSTDVSTPLWQLADAIAEVVGFKGIIAWDSTKPDGTPERIQDISRITSLGWQPRVSLDEGLKLTYSDFLSRKI